MCLNTAGKVTAYSSSEIPDSFLGELLSAVESTQLENVTGLREVTDVSAQQVSGVDPVPEGSGAGDTNNNRTQDGDGGSSVIEEPKSSVGPNDGAVSAGAAVGIALAALVLVLCALFVYRSRRRSQGYYDRKDAALKLAAHTEDEDDLFLVERSGGEDNINIRSGQMLGNDQDYDDRLPGTRKVHVLGEDDSLMSGSHHASFYRDRAVEIRPVHVPYDEATDKHSTGAIQFVATAVATPVSPPSIPSDARRSYVHDDTVML